MNTERIADELFHDCTSRVVEIVNPEDRADIWARLQARIHRVAKLEQPKTQDAEVANVAEQ